MSTFINKATGYGIGDKMSDLAVRAPKLTKELPPNLTPHVRRAAAAEIDGIAKFYKDLSKTDKELLGSVARALRTRTKAGQEAGNGESETTQ